MLPEMINGGHMKNWYAVLCKTGQEDRATTNLYEQAFDTYFPMIINNGTGNSKKTQYAVPLFPDYVFVNFDPEIQSARQINNTYGVAKLLTFGDVLVPVPNDVIEMLKKSAHSVNSVTDIDVVVSDEVKTIFKEKDGTNRNFMLLNLLSTKYKVKAA